MARKPLEFKNYNKLIKNKDKDQCPICFDKYNFKERVVETNCCKNVFHAECLKTAFENKLSCPICRKQICLANKPRTSEEEKKAIKQLFVDKPKVFDVIKQNIVDTFNWTPPVVDTDEEDNVEPIPIMTFMENNRDIQEEHDQARRELYGASDNSDTSEDEDDEIDIDKSDINHNTLTIVNHAEGHWSSNNNDHQYHGNESNNDNYEYYREITNGIADNLLYRDDINDRGIDYYTVSNDRQYINVNQDQNQGYNNDESIDRVIQLSQQTYQLEQEFQEQMNQAIQMSTQFQNDNNNHNNNMSNDINNINNITDETLQAVLCDIAIEESQLCQLNNIWNNTNNINFNNEDTDIEYDIEESDVEEEHLSPIQEMIKKRKSFNKQVPKLERDTCFQSAFRSPIMT
jgi:hypothetical protein